MALVSVCSAANWQTVTTFTGASDTTTDYFNVPTVEWRLTWSYTPSSAGGDYAVFSAFIYQKGETAVYKDFIMKTGRDQTSGTTYVHEGSKDYYLKIGAGNIQSYNIKIEYDSSAIPEYSTIAVIIAIALASATIIAFRMRMQNQKNR